MLGRRMAVCWGVGGMRGGLDSGTWRGSQGTLEHLTPVSSTLPAACGQIPTALCGEGCERSPARLTWLSIFSSTREVLCGRASTRRRIPAPEMKLDSTFSVFNTLFTFSISARAFGKKAGPVCYLGQGWNRSTDKGPGPGSLWSYLSKHTAVSALPQPGPEHPSWRTLIGTQNLWTCSSFPVQPWLSGFPAHAQCRPPLAFLCFIGPLRMFCFTWWSLVHPSYPGPAPCDLTELIHISFMTPTFLKSLCVIVLCVHMHMHVCVPVCLCVQVHVCAGVCVHVHICAGMCMYSYPCMYMWRSEDNIRCHLHKYHVLPLRECLSCWLGAHQLVYIGWSRSLRDCPVSMSLALRLQGSHHAQLSTWYSGSCKASILLTELSPKWSHVFYWYASTTRQSILRGLKMQLNICF